MKTKKAFTLVELLVVISIIAVLLAVLLPSLNKARFMAQRIVCMNSNRQQFMSQMNYTGSNNGKFAPHWSSTAPWTVRNASIVSGFNPKTGEKAGCAYDFYKTYFKDARVLECPALKYFATESPRDWGMVANCKWYDPGYSSPNRDKGGWDAVKPNINPPTPPYYICIPFNWFINYTPCDVSGTVASPIAGKINFYNGATMWPRTTTDCSSSKVAITHIFMCDRGPQYFRDMGHGGSTLAWIHTRGLNVADPITQTSGYKMKSLDNPIVFADGHTKYFKRTDNRFRVKFDSSPQTSAADAAYQIAW